MIDFFTLYRRMFYIPSQVINTAAWRSYSVSQIHSVCRPGRESDWITAPRPRYCESDKRDSIQAYWYSLRNDPQPETMILPSGYLFDKGRPAISMEGMRAHPLSGELAL